MPSLFSISPLHIHRLVLFHFLEAKQRPLPSGLQCTPRGCAESPFETQFSLPDSEGRNEREVPSLQFQGTWTRSRGSVMGKLSVKETDLVTSSERGQGGRCPLEAGAPPAAPGACLSQPLPVERNCTWSAEASWGHRAVARGSGRHESRAFVPVP